MEHMGSKQHMQLEKNGLPAARQGALRLRIETIMEDTSARGVAVAAIDKQGDTLYQEFFGWRDAERKLPIDEDTIFGLASVTKSFTALSMVQMEEQGILSLEDPVSRYVPEFTNRNQQGDVTISHLLSHSGGFFPLPRIVVDEVAADMGIQDTLEDELIYNDAFAQEGVERVAERLDGQTRLVGRPGERMSYCNDGYGLLSDIVRRHSDCGSFAGYLEEHILKPLGMDRSGCSFIRNTQDDNGAVLYSFEDGAWRADRDYRNNAFVLNGGGAMKSTLADLKKYVRMYLNEGVDPESGRRLISSRQIRELCKPRQYVQPGVYYGYGLETMMLSDMTVVCHSGSLPGVSSFIGWSYEAGIGVIVLCNTEDVPASAIGDSVLRAMTDQPIVPERPEHRPFAWDERLMEEAAGTYISGEGTTLVLSREGGEEGSGGGREGSGAGQERPGRGMKLTVNGKPVELQMIYPRMGLVRKSYSDVYLKILEDEERGVFAARYGTRIFPKES